jgi:CHAT domain-containing protein
MEWKQVSLANSATMHDILSNEKRRTERLFAIGNPDGSLPGAYEEVERIRDEIYKKNAEILTLDDATKERFFNDAKDYNIVHLATHGIIKKNPLDSYLILAGNTEEDQRLTLLEVAGYTKLREQTDLVFLSACQTAIEKGRSSGSELISLAEAFTMAGPPSLIATLWKVHDEATSIFVYEFYKTLRSKKNDKISALRAAQISLRESSDYSHPYFWAPFILIGDWR